MRELLSEEQLKQRRLQDLELFARAKEIAHTVKGLLEPRIIGQTRPAWACNCGCLGASEATAAKINIPDPENTGYCAEQITLWHLWSVDMQAHDGRDYATDITEFVPVEEVKALFAQHFGDLPKQLNFHLN